MKLHRQMVASKSNCHIMSLQICGGGRTCPPIDTYGDVRVLTQSFAHPPPPTPQMKIMDPSPLWLIMRSE